MRLGALDRKARITRPVEARNAYNEAVNAPQLVAEVWCRKQGVSGREFVAAAQLATEERAIITIRYRADVDASCSIEVDGKVYNIHSSREMGRRRWLELGVSRTE